MNWRRWTEELWAVAESQWLARTGQDLLYRRAVVVPAVAPILAAFDPVEVVDLGCGDGRSTGLILDALSQESRSPRSLALIDRSTAQLTMAGRLLRGYGARLIHSDFSHPDWYRNLPQAPGRRAYLSVFMLQEMPALGTLFTGLRMVMNPVDILVAIVVDPGFALLLRNWGRVTVATNGHSKEKSGAWSWCGEYPVDIGGATVKLPYFHRTLEQYSLRFHSAGLEVHRLEGLVVPRSGSARDVFRTTCYGEEILEQVSSRLIVAKLPETA